jgi:hypothetical protein
LTDSSQIQRFSPDNHGAMCASGSGRWVTYESHLAALEKEKAELAEISESLQAESNANFGDFERERDRAEAAEKTLVEFTGWLEAELSMVPGYIAAGTEQSADYHRGAKAALERVKSKLAADREEQEDAR